MRYVSLNRKLVAAVLACSTAAALLSTIAQLVVDYRSDRSSLLSDLETFEQGTVAGIKQDLWDVDKKAITEKIASALRVREVVSIRVTDDEGNIVGFGESKVQHHKMYDRTRPYRLLDADGKQFGQLDLVYTETFIVEKLRNRLLIMIVLNSMKALLVSFLLLYIFRRMLVSPIEKLSQMFRNQLIDNPDVPRQISLIRSTDSRDELTELIESVRTSIESLHSEQLRNTENEKIIRMEQDKAVYSARMAELGVMAGGVAHEINNPLAIIKGLNELIAIRIKEKKFEGLEEYLVKIDRNMLRITKIIHGLRHISRDGSKDPMESVSIASIFETVSGITESGGRMLSVELKFENPPNEIFVECRKVQLEQVLINLINNSADAIALLPSKWIRIKAEVRNGREVDISITDSGRGIPQSIVKNIFTPFFTSKEVGKGTGLGLSISAAIIKDLNGSLEYNDKSEHTQFLIKLINPAA